MHPECYPHILKFNDVFYKNFPDLAESLCIDMVRSAPAPQCHVGEHPTVTVSPPTLCAYYYFKNHI